MLRDAEQRMERQYGKAGVDALRRAAAGKRANEDAAAPFSRPQSAARDRRFREQGNPNPSAAAGRPPAADLIVLGAYRPRAGGAGSEPVASGSSQARVFALAKSPSPESGSDAVVDPPGVKLGSRFQLFLRSDAKQITPDEVYAPKQGADPSLAGSKEALAAGATFVAKNAAEFNWSRTVHGGPATWSAHGFFGLSFRLDDRREEKPQGILESIGFSKPAFVAGAELNKTAGVAMPTDSLVFRMGLIGKLQEGKAKDATPELAPPSDVRFLLTYTTDSKLKSGTVGFEGDWEPLFKNLAGNTLRYRLAPRAKYSDDGPIASSAVVNSARQLTSAGLTDQSGVAAAGAIDGASDGNIFTKAGAEKFFGQLEWSIHLGADYAQALQSFKELKIKEGANLVHLIPNLQLNITPFLPSIFNPIGSVLGQVNFADRLRFDATAAYKLGLADSKRNNYKLRLGFSVLLGDAHNSGASVGLSYERGAIDATDQKRNTLSLALKAKF